MDSSIYKKITDYLLKVISRNAGIPNYKLPSERMLAATFDTSRKPVRHAYEQLIERGYVTNVHGSGYYISEDVKVDEIAAHFHKTVKISLVVPSIVSRYSHAVLSGVNDFCSEKHMEYTIHISDNSLEKESELIRALPQSGIMGIILFPSDNELADRTDIIKLIVRKYPFVLVDRQLPNIHTSFVATDDHQAMVDVVQFLYQKHYKYPVYATPSANLASSLEFRMNGYSHGLLKYYKMATPRNLLKLEGTQAQQEAIMIEYLNNYPDTDVIIVSGVQRTPVISALQKTGLPHIRLMIFDDELSHAERDSLNPYIIQQDGYRIGYLAAEILYNHIWGDRRPVIRRLPITILDADNDVPVSDSQIVSLE